MVSHPRSNPWFSHLTWSSKFVKPIRKRTKTVNWIATWSAGKVISDLGPLPHAYVATKCYRVKPYRLLSVTFLHNIITGVAIGGSDGSLNRGPQCPGGARDGPKILSQRTNCILVNHLMDKISLLLSNIDLLSLELNISTVYKDK